MLDIKWYLLLQFELAENILVQHSFPIYKKNDVCISVSPSVCLKRNISLTAETIGFYYLRNILTGPVVVLSYFLGWWKKLTPHNKFFISFLPTTNVRFNIGRRLLNTSWGKAASLIKSRRKLLKSYIANIYKFSTWNSLAHDKLIAMS